MFFALFFKMHGRFLYIDQGGDGRRISYIFQPIPHIPHLPGPLPGPGLIFIFIFSFLCYLFVYFKHILHNFTPHSYRQMPGFTYMGRSATWHRSGVGRNLFPGEV